MIAISCYSDPIGIRKNLQQFQSQINTGFVPYVGAIDNVDLGSYDLSCTDLTSTSLTATRLTASDGDKKIVSTDISSWISGTTNQVTVTDDGDGTTTLSLPQNIHTGASPTFAGLTLSGLTATRLVASNGSKALISSDLSSWIAGTTNQVTVTDDGDGTITLSLPQDIHTGASPTFAGLTITGSISMSGGLVVSTGTKCDGYIIRDSAEVQTTDETQTTVDSITLSDENTYHCEAIVIGVKSDGSQRASARISCTVYRTGAGSATLQGDTHWNFFQTSDDDWDINFTVNSNDLRVSVTGKAATTIEWCCILMYVNMSN